MRYVRDTSPNPYFTENVSNLGGLGASPACACAHPIGDISLTSPTGLLALAGVVGLVFYFARKR